MLAHIVLVLIPPVLSVKNEQFITVIGRGGAARRNEMQTNTHLAPFLIIEIVTDQGMQINTARSSAH